ncbi:MAG: acetylxylan esterase [Clostridia bacterium]|nr:acetylxylan esterase [Clostridia bacterium]
MNPIYQVLPHPPFDLRLTADRHTDTHFPMPRFDSREAVDARREELQFNLRMAAGLYPWPEKTPLNTRRELVGEYDGYTIYKIMFESYPGLWSTGNLYLPRPLTGKCPAILNVIGHWEQQRLTRMDTGDYPQQIANFARMGFVCLVTDMIGMVDSRQLSHDYGRGERELWGSNGLGVQLWNNIRALDLLCSMPEVDADNIGVTGASGGGSQTLFLSLLDDRVKAAAPINMISLHMQGGCQCENAAGLRRDTTNTEMCAMLAPRPLFLAGSTGDWTKYQLTEEYPAIRDIYALYGAEEKVEQYYQIAPHQYNAKTRHRVYSFFARHLMGKDLFWEEETIETPYLSDMVWFKEGGNAPGFESDDEYFAAHKAELTARVASLPTAEKKKMLAWVTGIDGRDYAVADGDILEADGVTVERNILTSTRGEQIPWVRLTPKDWDGKRICLVLSGMGKACVEREEIQAMLADGVAVVSGDLFLTGEFGDTQPAILGTPNAERYFTTFHYTTAAHQARDVALLWRLTASPAEEATLWAEGTAARAAACALPLLEGVSKASLEEKALELVTDKDYMEGFFIPCFLPLRGLEGCLEMAECAVEMF